MINFAIMCGIVAMVAAFLLSLAYKCGMIEKAQVHCTNEFLSKLVRCDFCLSWWACVIVSVAAAIIAQESVYLLCPFIATIITRNSL